MQKWNKYTHGGTIGSRNWRLFAMTKFKKLSNASKFSWATTAT